MRTAKLLLVLGLSIPAFACKRDAGSAQTGAPSSTAEADALWAMAPESAALGVVISPRAVGMIEHAWLDVRSLLATAPELAIPNMMLGNQIAQVFGKPDITLADAGLTPTKGAAFFVMPGGGGIAVIPVGDREKFLAATKGTKGADSDSVGEATCKDISGSNVCARTPDLFAKLGKAKLSEKLSLVGTRGDIEVVGDLPAGPGLQAAGVFQLSRGGVVLRGVIAGMPPSATKVLGGKQVKAPGDRTTTSGFAVMSIAPMLANAPALPLVEGVTLADLGRSISGPVTMHVPAGSVAIDIRVPVSDPKPASTLLEHCGELAPLASAGASFYDGACHVAVPSLGYTLDMWVENNEIRVGKKGAPVAGVAAPMTDIGAELASMESVFAFWGRGTLYGQSVGEMPKVPSIPTEALMAIRGVSLLNELGASSRIEGDKLKITMVVRTIWSNPDDVVAKIVAIKPETFFEGHAGDAAKEIAATSPSSPFAADFQAGTGGMMAPMAVVGMLAAVAIPAFMDYMKHARRSDPQDQMEKIENNARDYYNSTP